MIVAGLEEILSYADIGFWLAIRKLSNEMRLFSRLPIGAVGCLRGLVGYLPPMGCCTSSVVRSQGICIAEAAEAGFS